MFSLAELHGLIVHLPLLAVPTLALLALLTWLGRGGDLVRRSEPYVFVVAAVGSALAVVSGLTVLQHARTELRGSTQRLFVLHLGLGLGLAALLVAVGWLRRRRWKRQLPDLGHGVLASVGVAGLALTVAGGYLGGQMVYRQGVGVSSQGQWAQTARGAELLAAGLASNENRVALGKRAFQTGLRCASCHGIDAKGGSGPPLAGGIDVARFRHTHGPGLFPSSVVSDRMIETVNAWLRTLPWVPHGD